ncbi:hypothetical protein AVEN_144938-1 [Araneus ventricosus]|uniref:Uncharacterized protein n=1 Tax=Araneus ventricosus TaxID=182803 RepID=A0A4Y2U3C6_ARAVE|nr:hypothetical protein AVEN_13837-1 [Araneus ventricosus]GBO07499.1 hypothetical protein AVEN_144938-1 [Araneus ventricosus]
MPSIGQFNTIDRGPSHASLQAKDGGPPKRLKGRGDLVVRFRCRSWRVPASKPDSIEDPPGMKPVALQIMHIGQTSYRWCGVEVWSGFPSSDDHHVI